MLYAMWQIEDARAGPVIQYNNWCMKHMLYLRVFLHVDEMDFNTLG
jgi:hypothetical protein